MLSRYDRAALFFGLDSLESRRMLAVSASVNSSHVLNITGTGGGDNIQVTIASDGKVAVSGVSTHFLAGTSTGRFNKINIQGLGGSDIIKIATNVPYVSSIISGGDGNDVITGGKGDDQIDGNKGNDQLSGAAGIAGGADLLRGDENFDTANYSDRTDNLNISLNNQADDGASGEHDNVQTEEVIAGAGNDTLTGSDGDDFLAGGAGKDVIHGNGGNDDITGSSGSDDLEGDSGDDFIQAKNNDVDSVSGGSNTGLDLASVDSIDVPAVQKTTTIAAQKAAALGGLLGPDSVPGSPSDLDETYGDNSGTQTGPDFGWDSVDAAAVDSQGRVVFVGSDNRFDGNGYGEDMVVTRYNADGSLDTGFGNEGEADINFPGPGYGYVSEDFAHGVAIGSGDTIVVVGSTFTDPVFSVANVGQSQFGIAKLTEGGDLDDSFGDGGFQTVDTTTDGNDPMDSTARAVTIQSDGNIVIAGDRERQNQQVTYDPAAEFSVDENPSNVWSYGYSEKLNDPINTYDTPTNQNQIDYWTASQLTNSSTLAPDVLHNGSGDTESPGINDGVLALDPGFYGEYSHITFTVPITGSYDITGTFGAAINDGNPTTDVHVLVNGEAVFDSELGVDGPGGDFDLPGFFLNQGDTVDFAVGFGSNQNFDNDATSLDAEVTRTSAPDDRTFAVARLTDTGQLDSNFNFEQGFNFMDVGTDEEVSSVALQNLPDDFGAQRIVVGGSDDGNFVVARFLPDGTQDFDFGDNGGYTSNSIEFGGTLNAIAVDGDNNIYAVGAVDAEGGGDEPGFATPLGTPMEGPSTAVLAKYDANGSFIGQTEHSSDATGNGASYNAVAVDSQGRILVAGDDGQDYILGRYTNDLNFDTTFADGPITTDLAPPGALGSDDKAILVGELSDGKIIAAGSSNVEDQFEASHLETSAARYSGGPAEGNAFDIEEFIDTNDFSDPPPELVPHLTNISGPALLYLESQPDDNGNVDIHTNNPKGDVVKITTVIAGDGTKNVAVTVNGVTTFYDVTTTNSITINTDGGADSVIADNSVTTKLIIYTGEGDDTVTGGGGTNFIFGGGGRDILNGGPKGDVVIGGAGEDDVFGNGGNDIVIGGPNNDHVNGNAGDDVVIPGTTAYDSDLSALSSLLAEWTSSHSFTTRVNNIKSGSSGGLNDPFSFRATGSNKTIFDDSDKDSLTGSSGRDLFFRKNSGPNKDLITDLNTGAGDQVVNF